MIRARKIDWLCPAFHALNRAAIRRRFFAFHARGLEHLRGLDPARAALVCSNHTNWWDGFAADVLCAEIPGRRLFMAQEEKNLARYRFFRWVGVFGLDLDGSPLPGLRFARALLADPRNLVWIFPQGRLARPEEPVVAKRGACFLAAKTGAPILPATFRYEWLRESRPTLYALLGAPLPPGATPGQLSETLAALHREARPDWDAPDAGWTPILPPRPSINRALDRALRRPDAGKIRNG